MSTPRKFFQTSSRKHRDLQISIPKKIPSQSTPQAPFPPPTETKQSTDKSKSADSLYSQTSTTSLKRR